MKTVVILGAGKIGRMVAHFLGCSAGGDYRLCLGDADPVALRRLEEQVPGASGVEVDFTAAGSLDAVLDGADAVVSCAPYHCNPVIAERARAAGVHYFDLTEDVAVTRQVAAMAEGASSAFVPQCGLAPGFITIVGRHLMQKMTDVRELRLRVGALPRYPANRLKYNLTWSTTGLINEYIQPCEVIRHGELTTVQPLENLEEIAIDGVRYEAFNTSGGLGTLAASLVGSVPNVNYKSLRYPGHSHLLKFLLDDLRMREHPDQLAEIFDRCLPGTFQDQVVIFCAAVGRFRGRQTENVYARTILHQEIDGENWSAIQIATAAGVCGVLDLFFAGRLPETGLVRMEDVDYAEFVANRFGRYYA